jgi:hypothetical protein
MAWLVVVFITLSCISYALGLHIRRKTMRTSMSFIRWEMETIKQDLKEARELYEKSL